MGTLFAPYSTMGVASTLKVLTVVYLFMMSSFILSCILLVCVSVIVSLSRVHF